MASHLQSIPDLPDWSSRHLASQTIDLAPPSPTTTSSTSFGSAPSKQHRRRRSSLVKPSIKVENTDEADRDSHRDPDRSAERLPPIPGTPNFPMSLSRSPSPRPGGGWSSPGLTSPYASVSGRASPAVSYNAGTNGANSVTWESAKAKSMGVNGYPSFSTQKNGFFQRHYRSISNSLPRFNMANKSYAEKEKLGRGRWFKEGTRLGKLEARINRAPRRTKWSFLVLFLFLFSYMFFYMTRKFPLNCQLPSQIA